MGYGTRRGENPISEERLDEMLADSFPSSDPMSTTPVVGVTSARLPRPAVDHRYPSHAVARVVAGLIALAFAALAFAVARRRAASARGGETD